MRFVVAVLLTAIWTFSYRAVAQEASRRSPKPAMASPAVVLHRCACPSDCWVAQTANFRVRWDGAEPGELRTLAASCEKLVSELKASWTAHRDSAAWLPQCEVVVHRGLSEYVAALGPGCEQTSGCTTIRIDQGHVVLRQIDLRADALDWWSESLPHELTHVVLADRFSARRIPPWADEGIAMLAESRRKRSRRLTALRDVVSGGMTYELGDLLNVATSPPPALQTAFYGQSLLLVSLLMEWGTRQQLLQFVEASQSQGPDAALAAVYKDRPLGRLERELSQALSGDRLLQVAQQPAASAAILGMQSTAALK
jgi:hypothetical protein